MKQWFTQPKDRFSSFYYYDDDSRELVRIRLELGRDDFSSSETGRSMGIVHQGNLVVERSEARLPPTISGRHLEKLARICLREKKSITLTPSDATEIELTAAIKKAIETGQVGIEGEDMDEEIDLSGDTTPARSRRRRHRCTII